MKKTQFLKRSAAVMLAAMTVLPAVPCVSAAETLMRGDVNGDKLVDVTDAQLTLQAYVGELTSGKSTLTDAQKTAADINGNGETDIADAQIILSYYVYNELSGVEMTWEQLLAPPEDAETAAKRVFTTFMDAVIAKDYETMLKVSNYGETLDASADHALTTEEKYAKLEEESSMVLSYEIISAERDTKMLNEYNAMLGNALANAEQKIAEEPDETERERMQRALLVLVPFDDLVCVKASYEYTVETEEGEEPEVDENGNPITSSTRDEEFYVYQKDGEWKAECSMVIAILKLAKSLKISSGNMYAKSVYTAFNSALTDLDAKGADLSFLNGDYYFKGADFADLPEVTAGAGSSSEEILAAIKYEVSDYFQMVTEMEDIAVHIENGVCLYSAASRNYDGEIIYGSYPHPISADDEMYPDIETALTSANKTD